MKMLYKDANIEANKKNQSTPLHISFDVQNVDDVMQLLLQNKANINTCDSRNKKHCN